MRTHRLKKKEFRAFAPYFPSFTLSFHNALKSSWCLIAPVVPLQPVHLKWCATLFLTLICCSVWSTQWVRWSHTDQSALGALKLTTHNLVKRQLSVIVNVDTAPQWQNQWSYRWHQSLQHKSPLLVSLLLCAHRKKGRKQKEWNNSALFPNMSQGYAVLWRLCALDR